MGIQGSLTETYKPSIHPVFYHSWFIDSQVSGLLNCHVAAQWDIKILIAHIKLLCAHSLSTLFACP